MPINSGTFGRVTGFFYIIHMVKKKMAREKTENNQSNETSSSNDSVQKSGWEELSSTIQSRWNQLTHEDLENFKLKAGQLAQIVQQRYGGSLEDARRQVVEFEQTLEDRVLESYRAATDELGNRYRGMRQNVQHFASDVRDFGLATTLLDVARHNPIAAMTAAFALGFAAKAAITPPRRRIRW
jgi:hypothetical protein